MEYKRIASSVQWLVKMRMRSLFLYAPRSTLHANSRGQVMLIITVLFAAAMLTIVFGVLSPIIREIQIGSDLQQSKQSYFTADAGGEDAYYRVRNNQTITFPYTLTLATSTATVSVDITGPTEEEITSQGNANNLIRTVTKDLTVTDGFSFNFGVQTGIGGLYMNNNSVVNGNVYSSGIVTSSNGSANSYNLIKGAVVSAGPNGSVTYVHATSTVYSRLIHDATIDGDAYYQTFGGATSSVTVTGTKYPNSTDQPTTTFPISDTLIATWETTAAAGGSVTCTNGSYTISSNVTIGPKKIPCDLTVSGNGTTVTLTGNVWVTGNITISGSGGTGVQMRVSDTIGDKSIPIIADNAGNQAGSGLISISGNSNFYGSTGNAESYVMLLSQNNSNQTGGSNVAINVINGAAGNLLIYASHGEIALQNNVNLREVTSYKLSLYNNTVVNYAIGLAQALFTAGPGGSWKIKRWREQ